MNESERSKERAEAHAQRQAYARTLLAAFESKDMLQAVIDDVTLSREHSKHALLFLELAATEKEHRFNNIFTAIAVRDVRTVTIQQLAYMTSRQSRSTCVAHYIRTVLTRFNAATYDKASQTLTLNYDSELLQALLDSARYRLQDRTLLSAHELQSIMLDAKDCKLLTN